MAIAESDVGRCHIVALPEAADALSVTPETLAAAVRLAREAGARRVGLAGRLPALSDQGRALVPLVDAESAEGLTTGQAVTAVAMANTVVAALAAGGDCWSAARVAVIGLGAIGRATLRHLWLIQGAPAALSLCDLPSRQQALSRFAADLPVPVRLLACTPALPREGYDYDLMIGAVSQTDVVAVALLRPGTILVDDSFPHCFDTAAAQARMDARQDVLLLGGGLVAVPGLRIHLDPDLGPLRQRLQGLVSPAGLPGCAVGALVDAPSLAPVDDAALARAAARMADLGLTVPPLHLEATTVPAATIARVARERRGAHGEPASDHPQTG